MFVLRITTFEQFHSASSSSRNGDPSPSVKLYPFPSGIERWTPPASYSTPCAPACSTTGRSCGPPSRAPTGTWSRANFQIRKSARNPKYSHGVVEAEHAVAAELLELAERLTRPSLSPSFSSHEPTGNYSSLSDSAAYSSLPERIIAN